jgi:hypothetical protein
LVTACIAAFIRVQKNSGFVGTGLKPARTEFRVQGDKALFLNLGTFLSVFICVHPCPIMSFVFKPLANMRSVFIRVHPRPITLFAVDFPA